MLKLNKKGVTLIELIVSFALVATAVIYFYQTLSTVYDLYVTSRKETQEYVDKDYALRIVDALINNNIVIDPDGTCGEYNLECNSIVLTDENLGKYEIIMKNGKKVNFYKSSADINEEEPIPDENITSLDIDVIKNEIKEYLQKNGTIGLTNYCNNKSWCNNVTSTISEPSKVKIKIYDNDTLKFEADFSDTDTIGSVSVKKSYSSGSGKFVGLFSGFEDSMARLTPKNNVLMSTYGETKTTFTFGRKYKDIKGLKINYYFGTSRSTGGTIQFILIDENKNIIKSSEVYTMNSSYESGKYIWGPKNQYDVYEEIIVSDNIIDKNFQLQVIVENKATLSSPATVYASIKDVEEIE